MDNRTSRRGDFSRRLGDDMTPRDEHLEVSIEIASLEAYAARTPKETRSAFDRLRNLIAQRSPERVREITELKETP
jgi:hypothetical protein